MTSQSCRFTRKQRLLNSQDYKYVFEQAYKSSDSCLTVLARKNGLNFARLGLIISKKRIRHAVARNRLKRLIRESFRKNQQCLAGLDLVVLAKYRANKVDNRVLLQSLAKHWQFLKL